MPRKQVENINPQVLRQCREQIGLSIEEAQRKAGLKTLAKIEAGSTYPTVNQIEKLAKRYHVPVWVFLKEELPEKYRFDKSVAFRKFRNNPINNYEVRSVIANVMSFRELLLELRDDLEEPIQPFAPPKLAGDNPRAIAKSVRQWLGCSKPGYSFKEWRQMIENHNVFVFMTSKYKGWSKVAPEKFRGLSIYHPTLPIIIVNNSDTNKAQSFTLFHELGHLLKKQSVLDEQKEIEMQDDEEKWCDRFAGEVLMPHDDFLQVVETFSSNESLQEQIDKITKFAGKFKVSSYALLVRMRHLGIIGQSEYKAIENQFRVNYINFINQRKIIISRNRAKEALDQYGGIYSNTIVQIYRNQEIGLHKFCILFGLKKVSDALRLEASL